MKRWLLLIYAVIVASCLALSPTAAEAISVTYPPPSAAVATWGTIIGTLANQADLGAELDARCLESVFGTSLGAGVILDAGALKASAILQKYHGVDPSANVLSFLGATNYAGMQTLTGWYSATGDLDT
ncbi:unnamed protein product, partial [marine sediment metagenome]